MKRNISAVFSSQEVMTILARHLVAARGIEVDTSEKFEAQLLAVVERDAAGEPVINQYKLDVSLTELEEKWRGGGA